MADQIYDHERGEIRGTYDVNRCLHAAECINGLPTVFDPTRRPWVDLSAAVADDIASVLVRCPTGALRYERLDAASQENAPDAATVVVKAENPLYSHASCRSIPADGVADREEYRVALCRCGAPEHKPFCDHIHARAGFTVD
jgi:uncharacterized Fe-S cluster protein YjdI/CDGSH-type Zn-finger protein